ncbi:MAG TPA: sulfotransferase [Phenylobacterium sp.]|jgi:hypothetical protein
MGKPDFLCVGAQQAGTTWLHQMLRQNPGVWLGPFQEYQFFNALFVKGDAEWVGWHVRTKVHNAIRYSVAAAPNNIDLDYLRYLMDIVDEHSMFTEAWYSHIFSRGGQAVKGDISPAYCSIPAEGVDYVLRTQGPIPVIFLVRDPAGRALSQLRMNISRTRSGPPTTRAQWEQVAANPEIAARGDYRRYIADWLARYPEQKLLFVPFRDVDADPLGVLRRVEQHIGVGAQAIYAKAGERVYEGADLELPGYVTEMVQQQFRPQYDYLERTFGKAFAQRV